MTTTSVNVRGLVAKINAIRRDLPNAERHAVALLGRAQVDLFQAISPRDTNRYVRGWLAAGNSAGVGSWSLPPIEESRSHVRSVARVEAQLRGYARRLQAAEKNAEYWHRLYQRRYADTNRRDRWERNAKDRVRRADVRAEKLRVLVERLTETLAQLRADPSAIVIGGRRTKSDLAVGRLITVRDREYGGVGAIIQSGDRTYIRLHNLEPHASIVESRSRVVGRVVAALRIAGLQRVRAGMKHRIRMAAR